MDLAQINQKDTVKHLVTHPDEISGVIKDESGKEFFVELYGKHTTKYKREFAEAFKALAEFAKENKEDNEAIEAEQDKCKAAFLAKITKSHHLILNGKKVPAKDLEAVYLDFSWLAVQADKSSSNAGAYIEKKSKS